MNNNEDDVESLETYLRAIVKFNGIQASYVWWQSVRHRYPLYEWNGKNVTERTFDKTINRTDEL